MDIKPFCDKIAAYQKTISFQEMIRSIASRYPVNMYREQGFISIYPDSTRKQHIVKSSEYDIDSGENYIMELGGDPFTTIPELFVKVPVPGFHHFDGTENCDYANHISNTKNAYLSFHATGNCENVLYSISTKIHSKNIYNSMMARIKSENVYMSVGVVNSQNIFYSKYINDSHDIRWSTNCVGCQECLFCDNLQNQSYCIENISYSKEDYLAKKQQYLMQKEKFQNRYESLTNKAMNLANENCQDCVYMLQGTDVVSGHYSHFVKNGHNLLFSGHKDGLTNAYNNVLTSGGTDYYGVCAIGGDSEYIYCSVSLRACYMVLYSYFCEYCRFCFGCVGLRNKEYCIYNKQYSKEEWYQKMDEIFQKMEKDGTLGQFFPASMNPFYYNDTLAYLVDSTITKEQALALGYLWRDEAMKIDLVGEVLESTALEHYEGMIDQKRVINPLILQKAIRDSDGNVYRIMSLEKDFLEKRGLPLPRIHWLTRIKKCF